MVCSGGVKVKLEYKLGKIDVWIPVWSIEVHQDLEKLAYLMFHSTKNETKRFFDIN